METNEKEIKLPETCSFNEIKKKIGDENEYWLIGERKWTLERNNDILKNENENNLPINNGETGIFLTKNISNLDDFNNCTRLIFFNDKEQYQFIAVDKKCAEFVYYHSEIVGTKTKLKNVVPKESKQKDNFRFTFAQNLGAIHNLNKGDKIYAIVNEENREWRLGYELPKQQ